MSFFSQQTIGAIGGPALGVDASPNAVAPAAARIAIFDNAQPGVKRDRLNVWTAGGTGACQLQFWFRDQTTTQWVQFGGAVNPTAGNLSFQTTVVGDFAGAELFCQVVANAGGVQFVAWRPA